MGLGLPEAIIGGAVLSGGMGLLGASQAASAQRDAAAQSAAVQRDIYNQQRKDFDPYLQAGYKGLGQAQNFDLMKGVGNAPSYDTEYTSRLRDYAQSPAFQAQNTLAQQALQRRLGASGKNYGGSAATAGAQLEQQLIASDYDKYRGDLAQRYKALQGEYAQKRDINQNEYNRLMDMVKVGQGAAGSVGQAGNQYAQGAANTFKDIGNANAGYYSGLGALPGTMIKDAASLKQLGSGGWFGSGGGFSNSVSGQMGQSMVGADEATQYALG